MVIHHTSTYHVSVVCRNSSRSIPGSLLQIFETLIRFSSHPAMATTLPSGLDLVRFSSSEPESHQPISFLCLEINIYHLCLGPNFHFYALDDNLIVCDIKTVFWYNLCPSSTCAWNLVKSSVNRPVADCRQPRSLTRTIRRSSVVLPGPFTQRCNMGSIFKNLAEKRVTPLPIWGVQFFARKIKGWHQNRQKNKTLSVLTWGISRLHRCGSVPPLISLTGFDWLFDWAGFLFAITNLPKPA